MCDFGSFTVHDQDVEPEHEDLPSFYWLPKLHKNPYGKRFITASNRCTTKSLSKLLTTCLAKITCHFREYCNGIYNRTGVNCFWIVDNSQQVLNRIRKTNYFSPAKHFDSFDFSTLYTSIPHDSLKIALPSLKKHIESEVTSFLLWTNMAMHVGLTLHTRLLIKLVLERIV